VEALWQDLRLGIRWLIKNPGFTGVAVLTLTLGIGANTAMFTVLNAMLLRTLPVKDAEQLVLLSDPNAHGIGISDGSGTRSLYAYSEFQDLRDHNQVFSGIFAADSNVRTPDVAIESMGHYGETEPANFSLVSGDYFRVLGIRALLGRTSTADVDRMEHASPVAVISYGCWTKRFARDGSVLGRKIRVRKTILDIIGVAPEGFSGETVGLSADIWVPLTMQTEVFPAWTDFLARPSDPLQKILWLQVMARLKPGVTREQAQSGINVNLLQARQAEGKAMAPERRREYLDAKIVLADGSRGANALSDSFGSPLQILMAVVGLVLLIACANVANLLLARGAARQREIAVRVALGAGRRRVIQQLLTESVLLALISGALGLLLAQWADSLLVRLVSIDSTPVALDLHPDVRILAFTMVVSFLTGVLFGLAPGLRAARTDLNFALKGSATGTTRGGRHAGMSMGRVLVAGQIAVSLSVLIVAGLFLHSLQKLASLNPGFDHDHLLQFNLMFLEANGYKGAGIHQLHQQLLERLETVPGVRGATLAFMGLFTGNGFGNQVSVDGSLPKPDPEYYSQGDLVSPRHFATIGQPLLMGRDITPADERSVPLAAVINQTFARKFFGKSNPIGKIVTHDRDHPQQFAIVGVVADAKHNSLREPATPQFYLPFFQVNGDEPSSASFEIRYSGNPATVAAAIRAAVKEAAPSIPPVEIHTMNELMGQSLITERVITQLAAFFGLLALVLASIGLYGVMAYSVAGRTNEIGIRISLGAQPRQILRLVLRETAILIGIGVALGLPSVLIAKRVISSQLYGLTALDPAAILVATLVLAVVAILAGYFPARWASKVDPLVALRHE
jgi:predicted permease